MADPLIPHRILPYCPAPSVIETKALATVE